MLIDGESGVLQLQHVLEHLSLSLAHLSSQRDECEQEYRDLLQNHHLFVA